MRRIRCPKCDEPILFDDAQYNPGRLLIFSCPACQKQFRLRLPDVTGGGKRESKIAPGTLIVLENAFQFKQEISLHEGENVIGREVKGTHANAAFRTVDPSIDTTHCIISVSIKADGIPCFTLRDAPSNTGTCLQGDLLGSRARVLLHDGDIINIGAATLILRVSDAG